MYEPRELGSIYRRSLEAHLSNTYGTRYGVPKGEWICFRSIKFLVPYSRCHPTEKAYFYGVNKRDWDNWGEAAHLILIVPEAACAREISPVIRYITLSPGATHRMLRECSSDQRGNRKVMVYTNGGAIDVNRPSLEYVKHEVNIQRLQIVP